MPSINPLKKAIDTIDKLPLPMTARVRLRSMILGRVVPLVGTAGLQYEVLEPGRVVVSIANRRKVRNHIRGVHAAASALLAETATGFVVAMSLPGDKLPLIKTMHVEYTRRGQGAMRAEAWLEQGDMDKIAAEPKGEVVVQCRVTDESGGEPVKAHMTWAWVPGKRPE